MIVNCPNCNKQISSKASSCPNCEFLLAEFSEQDLGEFQRRKLRDRLYHLKMASYAAISVFLAAFGWYWWQTGGFQQPSGMGPVLLLAASAVGYLAIRVLLILARRAMKKL